MSAIYFIVAIAVIVACTSAFGIVLIGKLGGRNEIIARAPRLISELFSCDFCLSFWLSLILAIILAIFFRDLSVIFTPVISTPITRILL